MKLKNWFLICLMLLGIYSGLRGQGGIRINSSVKDTVPPNVIKEEASNKSLKGFRIINLDRLYAYKKSTNEAYDGKDSALVGGRKPEEKEVYKAYITFKNGERVRLELFYLNGQKAIEENFENSRLEGPRIEYFKNGNMEHISIYHLGTPNQNADVSFFSNGVIKKYTKYYPELKWSLHIRNFDSKNLVQRTEWACDTSNNTLIKDYYENGNLLDEYQVNDGLHTYKDYFSNGQLKIVGDFIMAPWYRTGGYKEFYENGMLRGNFGYKNATNINECNIKNGDWIEYDPNGKILSFEVWKDGVKIK